MLKRLVINNEVKMKNIIDLELTFDDFNNGLNWGARESPIGCLYHQNNSCNKNYNLSNLSTKIAHSILNRNYRHFSDGVIWGWGNRTNWMFSQDLKASDVFSRAKFIKGIQQLNNTNQKLSTSYVRSVSDYVTSGHQLYHSIYCTDPRQVNLINITNFDFEKRKEFLDECNLHIKNNGYEVADFYSANKYETDISEYADIEQQTLVLFNDEKKHTVICEIFVKEYNSAATISFLAPELIETLITDLRKNLSNKFEKTAPKIPTFYTIGQRTNGFYLTDMNLSDAYTESIIENYEIGFDKIYKIAIDSIIENKKGLILFHGEPGTGKTCFIKHLICQKYERKIVFIPPHLADSIASPAFVSFVKDELKNCVLLIEDAETILQSRESAGYTSSAVSNLLNITDGLMGDALNILIICTFNTNIVNIDKALLRKGRLLLEYEFKKLSKERTNELTRKLFNKDGFESMALCDIYNLETELVKQGEKVKQKMGFV